ncbi:MAG: hypothetical protein Salg2KO_08570 [Salibacteraceae bacterium]
MDVEEQINFTNKRAHPSNSKMVVYRHAVKEQAEYFAELLVEESIEFEAQIDHDHPKQPMYFGVARAQEKRANYLNYIALGKNRPKFIDSAPLRWLVILISIGFVFLAILGAILSSP